MKEKIMKLWSGVFCAFLLLSGCVFESNKKSEKPDVIVDNGVSSYSIVIPAKPKPWEKYAAGELTKYVAEMTGVKLPVVSDDSPQKGPEFILGLDNKRLQGMAFKDEKAKWGENGFTLKTKDKDIIIVGGEPRGVIYGVLELLEKWGIGFFNEDITRIPKHKQLVLSKLNETIVPSFSIRDTSNGDMENSDLWTHQRLTGPNWGGKCRSIKHGRAGCWGSGLHSFLQHVPAEKYFKSHPEYFSLRGGERIPSGQLCLTNKDLPGIVSDKLLTSMRKAPANLKYWGVGQMDNLGFCQCPECMALAKREGAQSGPIIEFVNKVAEKTAKEFPQNTIVTFAYQYSEQPPANLKGHDNVAVQLCTINADRLYPIAADSPNEKNRYYYKILKGWSKNVKTLQVWDYITDFTDFMAIHPDYFTWGDNLRLYKECGVDLVFMQGPYNNRHAEFSDLRRYVMSRLMWDVNRDCRKLIRKYCDVVYGDAGPMVYEYMEAAHKIALKNNKDKNFPVTARWGANKCGFTHAELKYWIDRFEAAVAKEKSPLIQKQLKFALMPLLYTMVTAERPHLRPSSTGLKPDKKIDAEYLKVLDRFKSLAKELDIHRIRESAGTAENLVMEIENSSRPHDFYKLTKGGTTMKLLPGFGGQIKEVNNSALGGKLLLSHESSCGGWHQPGWSEFYEIDASSNSETVTMKARLPKGITLQRTVRLLSENSFSMTEQVGNTHTEQQKGQVTVFLRFPVGNRKTEQLWTLGKDQKWHKQDWMERHYVGFGGEQFEKLFGGGAWALQHRDSEKSTVVRFSPKDVPRIQYWSIDGSHEFTIMISSAPKMLNQRQSTSITLNVEFLDKKQSDLLFNNSSAKK
jgi:hypothetical protein